MPVTPETWLNSFTVNLTTAGDQRNPRLTQLANGNILVVWDSDNDTGVGDALGLDLIGQIFTPMGQRVGVEFRVNDTFFSDDERNVGIAALPGGGFLAAYTDFDISPTSAAIRLTQRDSAGLNPVTTTIFEADPSSPGSSLFGSAQVAVLNDRFALVVATEAVSGGARIMGRVFDPLTNTAGPLIELFPLADNNSSPDVAVLGNGHYVISALTVAGGDNRVTYRIIDPFGTNVLGATAIADTAGDGLDSSHPRVAALTGGGFVIAWHEYTGTGDVDLRYQRFDLAGAQLGAAVTVASTGTDDDNNEPLLVGLPDGGFLIVFEDENAGAMRVQRIAADGALVGANRLFQGGGDYAFSDALFLGDGRVAVTFLNPGGEIGMEILDTRDGANATPVYTDGWQIGTVGDDVIVATGAQVHGHAGNDVIEDDAGENSLFGGAGNDRIILSGVDAAERAEGGAGSDTLVGIFMNSGTTYNLATGTVAQGGIVQVATGFDHVQGDDVAESLIGNGLANSLSGGGGDDTLFGGGGNDRLDGGSGNDRLQGGLGNDRYVVGAAGDRVLGEVGFSLGGGIDSVESYVSFTLPANVEILRLMGTGNINGTGSGAPDNIVGNTGANTLTGGFGNDLLNGKAGADRILGGSGSDTLIGEAGNDTFVYLAATESGVGAGVRDFINGFTRGAVQDRIDLQAIDANTATAANDAFTFIGNAAFTAAGQVRIQSLGGPNAVIVEMNLNANLAADMQIFVNQTTTMAAGDFLL